MNWVFVKYRLKNDYIRGGNLNVYFHLKECLQFISIIQLRSKLFIFDFTYKLFILP
jgi:hypothetical protein